MIVQLRTIIDAPMERVWAEMRQSRLLLHVARPLVSFTPVDPPVFPAEWTPGDHVVALRLFGVAPAGRQRLSISFPEMQDGARAMRDDGEGDLATVWDHLITVSPRADGRTDYEDRVRVEAGVLTPMVWLFARIFYGHRQRRWRRLAREGFRYD